jgi:16S rRNA (guanine(527)-N(7))-methyltransferase RsmG
MSPSLGLTGWEHAAEGLSIYKDLLLQASDQRSLLSVSQRNETSIWEHILDSMQVLRLVETGGAGASLLDIGSGNGLPGIPLAIALQATEVRLLERSEAKLEFLEYAIATLGLRSTATIKAELESRDVDLGRFSSMTARAVGPGPVFRALKRINNHERAPSCFAYATAGSSAEWIELAKEAGYAVSARFDLKLPDKSLTRSYLKFTPQ